MIPHSSGSAWTFGSCFTGDAKELQQEDVEAFLSRFEVNINNSQENNDS
jgi:hypothetical protein